MKKLTIEILSAYFPYKLKGVEYAGSDIHILNMIQIRAKVNFIWENEKEPLRLGRIDCIPILWDLSYLTKEIEHNGERFIPIVELAKIEDKSFLKVIAMHPHTEENIINKRVILSYLDKDNNNLVFNYDFLNNSFSLRKRTAQIELINTYKLYQKFFEWHFDVFGLIEKGLAINKNTIS